MTNEVANKCRILIRKYQALPKMIQIKFVDPVTKLGGKKSEKKDNSHFEIYYSVVWSNTFLNCIPEKRILTFFYQNFPHQIFFEKFCQK